MNTARFADETPRRRHLVLRRRNTNPLKHGGIVFGVLLLVWTLGGGTLQAEGKGPDADRDGGLTKPTPQQLAWQNLELGVIIDLDISVFRPGGWKYVKKDAPYDPAIFNPKKLDTDQWVRAAKAAGARYAVFTATHFEGFMTWQSDLYPYGLKQSPWREGKGDIVADFVASCRKAGLKPGIYFSTHRNSYFKVDKHKVEWGKGGEGQAAYNRICERMCEELCSRYGELVELWMDAGVLTPEEGGPDFQPIVRKHQPKIIFYKSDERRDHRWCGYSDMGKVDYPCWSTMPPPDYRKIPRGKLARLLHSGDPDGSHWSPAFAGLPLRSGWFWTSTNEKSLKSLDRLVRSYYETVGRNANLVLGACVNQDGLVPEKDVALLKQFGETIRQRFAHPIAETRGTGELYELDMETPEMVDHIVLMEDISMGQRVRDYRIEVLKKDGGWKPLAKGTSIGHKRIHRFKPVETAGIRVRITRSVGTPALRSVSVFGVGPSSSSPDK